MKRLRHLVTTLLFVLAEVSVTETAWILTYRLPGSKRWVGLAWFFLSLGIVWGAGYVTGRERER